MRGADLRQECLSHEDRRHRVDLELAAQLVGPDELERAGHHDPGVVDDSGQGRALQLLLDAASGLRDRRRVGDVEFERRGAAGAQPLGILRLPDAGEHLKALVPQPHGARVTDAG